MLHVLMVYALGAMVLIMSLRAENIPQLKMAAYLIAGCGMYSVWSLYDRFDEANGYFQMLVTLPWIKEWGIHLTFAIDAYALWCIILSVLVINIAAIMTCQWCQKALKEQLLVMYLIQAMLLLCFSTLDGLVFIMLFEALLYPMYLWIVVWGGEERQEAGWLFLVYSLAGSVFMLVAAAYVGVSLNSFSWQSWADASLSLKVQLVYFLAFTLAMMVKLPLLPLHSWLPTVHTQASSGASMVLSAVFLKIAAYGLLRWVLPIVPDAARLCSPYMIGLALLSMFWGLLLAWVQQDIKKIIAYASIQHMAWIVLALFMGYFAPQHAILYGFLDGVIVQIFAHGIVSAGLFMAFGMMYQRTHRRDRALYGGFASVMPALSGWFVMFFLANMAIPGSLNFVAEWMILLNIFYVQPWVGALAALSFILSCNYTLDLYNSVFLGPVQTIHKYKDITTTESFICAMMVAIIFVCGFFPRVILEGTHATSMVMMPYIYRSKLD